MMLSGFEPGELDGSSKGWKKTVTAAATDPADGPGQQAKCEAATRAGSRRAVGGGGDCP